ncbi:MAG TPA: tetratricopeptide repeat protein, partial [Pyrinomonadaceae bacterium]|nr:tetratricopeptide repeat protein [Pyrinomonadaceae bacterium]
MSPVAVTPDQFSTFGELLKYLRRQARLTQRELAIAVGYSDTQISRIEQNQRVPDSTTITALFVPALYIEQEPKWVTRLLELAKAAHIDGISATDNIPIPTTPNNLPHQLTSFISREREQDEIISLIGKNRLVTLMGVGGIGKSRLSIQTASALLNDYPNGTWLVELAPLSDPALVPQTIASTLGLIEQAGRSPLMILTDFLQAKRVLLVLDNCEHLIQACAQLAEALLHACPDLHILATSREALGIAGETLYLVPPLTTPDPLHTTLETLPHYEAVQLFVERAQSSLKGFTLIHENAPAIAQVCHRLDGIPLAIELAAARVRLLRIEEIAARLDDRFHLLTGGARTALPRHQTLQATIDWSHDLFSEPERVLLRRLAVFAGGWTLEAVESVCSGAGIETYEILDLLTQLLNKSVLIAERRQGHDTRYRMLETIRQYAREKLWSAGEGEILRQRHLAYNVDLAERAEPKLRGPEMVMWLDRLEAEHDNIREALTWAMESDIEAELRLASALLWFWHIRGYKREGTGWLERALSIEEMERGERALWPQRAMIRGKALYVAGFLSLMFIETEKGAMLSEESLTLFQGLGTMGRQGKAYALWNLAVVGQQKRDLRQAKALTEESLVLFQEVGDKFGIAQGFDHLGFYALHEGNCEQARMLWEEHLALRQEIGDKDGNALALHNLGILASQQGDYKQATIHYEASLVLFRELKNKWALSMVLDYLGRTTQAQGDYERAANILEESLALSQDLGDRFAIAHRLNGLGSVSQSQGDYGRATQMHEEALTLFREMGNQVYYALALWNLGLVAMAQGDAERATNKFEEVLSVSRGSGNELGMSLALYGLGKVAKS